MPSCALAPPVVSALTGIVDYAGLFPPAALPLDEAAAEYVRQRQSPYAWMLNRFIIRAAQVQSLEHLLQTTAESVAVFPLTVLFDGTNVQPLRNTRPEAYEVALRPPECEVGAVRSAIRALSKVLEERAPGLPVAIELPRKASSAVVAEAMEALAECGFAAKVRCGGVTADATPSVHEIADFLLAAMHAGVPVKATAGLHHPVRAFNEAAGFVMHGFLNVLAGAAFAPGLDGETMRAIIAEEDASAFAFDERGLSWHDFVADRATLEETRRRRFLGFGSCSFTEPVEDLIALRVLLPA